MSLVGIGQTEPQAPPLPVPSPDAQKAALQLIRDVFKEDYSKRTPNDRQALAKKLQAQAQEIKDEPASLYVLLLESRDLYVEAGDVESAVLVIDQLSSRFPIAAAAMKADAVGMIAKNLKTPKDMAHLGTACLKLIDDAAASEDYDTARRLAEQASALAKKAKDIPLMTHVQAKTKEVSEAKSKFERIRKARETLAANPEDPAANSMVGRYECSTKANWKLGLPMLAKGSEEATRGAALRDLASPVNAPEQAAVGDAWWTIAESETFVARDNFRARALFWYEQSCGGLAGLTKTKVEQRLSALRSERLSKGDWIDMTDPSLFGYVGKPGQALEVSPNAGFFQKAALKSFPKAAIDGITLRVHPSPAAYALILFENESLCVWVDGRTQDVRVSVAAGPNNWNRYAETKIEKPGDCWVTILIVDGSYLVYADGKELHRLKTTTAGFTSLSLNVNEGLVKFDQIKLRRRH